MRGGTQRHVVAVGHTQCHPPHTRSGTFEYAVSLSSSHARPQHRASRDKDGVFYRTPVQLAFTDEENDRGKTYLEEVGCDDPRKIVCLVARDNAYLDSLKLKRNWSYHSFRDTKIEDYRDVVQVLVARGYWVFRMGKQVNDPLDIGLVIVVFVVGQVIEGNFLTPKLVGDRVNLHAVWILFALMGGGALFGFVGILLAVPVAAVIGVLVRFALGQYLASPLYGGGATEATPDDRDAV